MASPVRGCETLGEDFNERGFPPNGSKTCPAELPPVGGLLLSKASAAWTTVRDTPEPGWTALITDFTDCGLLTPFTTPCERLIELVESCKGFAPAIDAIEGGLLASSAIFGDTSEAAEAAELGTA